MPVLAELVPCAPLAGCRAPVPAEPVACAPLAGCHAPRGGWAGCLVIRAGRRRTDPVRWPPTHRPYRQAGARGRPSRWRVPRWPAAVPPVAAGLAAWGSVPGDAAPTLCAGRRRFDPTARPVPVAGRAGGVCPAGRLPCP
ncbi:MAG: hypothetical protein KAY13_08555, partial [Zoogloea sp.]|nr:hypothetical protein [Zoogloea sp.]